jgi:hypothetical protein
VQAPAGDKDDDIKNSFHEELKQVFDQFPRYHMIILLDFNAKVGREDIFKPVIGEGTREANHKANALYMVHCMFYIVYRVNYVT